VPTHLIGTDAFQEADTTGIFMPIVKHSYLVTKAEDIPRVFMEAFHLASTGRPGPVLIDFRVEQEDSVYPMVPAGKALHEMIRRPSAIVETATDE